MFYGLLSILLFLDLFTKHMAETSVISNATIPVISDWLSWKLIHNSGASFGLLAGHLSLIAVGSIAMILLIFYLYLKSESKGFIVQASFALILSGANGNLVDRIAHGYVTDFIQFRWWPAVFNVADMEIRTGVVVLLILIVSKRWKLKPGKTSFASR